MRGELMNKKQNILLTAVVLAFIALSTSVIVSIVLAQQNSQTNSKSYLTANTIVSQVIKKMNYQKLFLDSVRNSFVLKNPIVMFDRSNLSFKL